MERLTAKGAQEMRVGRKKNDLDRKRERVRERERVSERVCEHEREENVCVRVGAWLSI